MLFQAPLPHLLLEARFRYAGVRIAHRIVHTDELLPEAHQLPNHLGAQQGACMGVHGVAQLLELLRRHTACLRVLRTDHHGRRRVRVRLGKHQVRDDSDLLLLLVLLRTQDDLACLRLGRLSLIHI